MLLHFTGHISIIKTKDNYIYISSGQGEIPDRRLQSANALRRFGAIPKPTV